MIAALYIIIILHKDLTYIEAYRPRKNKMMLFTNFFYLLTLFSLFFFNSKDFETGRKHYFDVKLKFQLYSFLIKLNLRSGVPSVFVCLFVCFCASLLLARKAARQRVAVCGIREAGDSWSTAAFRVYKGND